MKLDKGAYLNNEILIEGMNACLYENTDTSLQ